MQRHQVRRRIESGEPPSRLRDHTGEPAELALYLLVGEPGRGPDRPAGPLVEIEEALVDRVEPVGERLFLLRGATAWPSEGDQREEDGWQRRSRAHSYGRGSVRLFPYYPLTRPPARSISRVTRACAPTPSKLRDFPDQFRFGGRRGAATNVAVSTIRARGLTASREVDGGSTGRPRRSVHAARRHPFAARARAEAGPAALPRARAGRAGPGHEVRDRARRRGRRRRRRPRADRELRPSARPDPAPKRLAVGGGRRCPPPGGAGPRAFGRVRCTPHLRDQGIRGGLHGRHRANTPRRRPKVGREGATGRERRTSLRRGITRRAQRSSPGAAAARSRRRASPWGGLARHGQRPSSAAAAASSGRRTSPRRDVAGRRRPPSALGGLASGERSR